MYDKNDILGIETKVLLISSYYASLQISFNEYLKTGTKDISAVNIITETTTITIDELRSILFKLCNIRSNEEINYDEVARRLYFLGSVSRTNKLHRDEAIWCDVISIVERGSFSAVFGHFISRIRNLNTNFTRIGSDYEKLTVKTALAFEKQLLQLSTDLQEFISYAQAVKIMLNFIDKEGIFAQASCTKHSTEPVKNKPVLRIVK